MNSKKKKKSTTQQRLREEETNASKSGGERAESVEGEGNGRVSAAGSRSESPVVPSGKTGAQMRFEEVQKARVSLHFSFPFHSSNISRALVRALPLSYILLYSSSTDSRNLDDVATRESSQSSD